MNTLGYLFVFVAALLIRAVVKGRAANVTQDLGDALTAAIRGDAAAFKEVANRTGDSGKAPQAVIQATPGTSGDSAFTPTKGLIGAAAIKRGSRAKGYGWGATGPTYYDCSGLMWRACQDADVYSGGRFTTQTIGLNAGFKRVADPQVDDIVCWTNQHMGVITGNDTFYSAKSYKSGIGYDKISTWKAIGKPVYYRPVKAQLKPTGSAGKGISGGGGGSW